jgi:hypothetical protein
MHSIALLLALLLAAAINHDHHKEAREHVMQLGHESGSHGVETGRAIRSR